MSVDERERTWKGSGKGKAKEGGAVFSEEDRELFLLMMCLLMNCEYKYWSFMEAYPAHSFPPVKAKIEAMDVLTWAWTGNNSFYSLTSATFAHFIYIESVSFHSIVPFLPLSLRKNAGAYSTLWRYFVSPAN